MVFRCGFDFCLLKADTNCSLLRCFIGALTTKTIVPYEENSPSNTFGNCDCNMLSHALSEEALWSLARFSKYGKMKGRHNASASNRTRPQAMNALERADYLTALDNELLKGGAMFSEWCVLIVRECDEAFVAGANLATIVTAACAIETYLRAEYGNSSDLRFVDLIDRAPFSNTQRDNMHKLRKYRNKWVHLAAPEDDQELLNNPGMYVSELQDRAVLAQRLLRETLYENQFV